MPSYITTYTGCRKTALLNAAKDCHKPVKMQSEYLQKGQKDMAKITLKAARVNVGLTQVEAAERLGISPSTIRNWEKGCSFPKPPQIMVLCKLYGVSYDNIFFG